MTVVRRRPIGHARAALLFLLPALALLVALRIVPTLQALLESFQKGSDSGAASWAGVENFVLLLTDPGFWKTVAVTGEFLLVIVPFQIVVALVLALLLVEKVPGRSLVRVLVFIPVAAPAAVATVVWGIAFQPQGPINGALTAVGLPAQPFLTSPQQALAALIVLMSWIGIGYWTLFLIAGIQDIPRDLYEAAALDGAGFWQTLWSVTLPSLRRTLAFVVVANTVSSLLAFVPVQILTQGGPAGSTRLVMYDLYNTTFLLGDRNLGQAEVVLLLLVLIAITVVQFRLLSRER
ncbi:carbohydrate ABC transporter permease [Fodinicola acaciae]|uniref:carbohydrate ABC transporter permease n=1 Tax=Fodinicola acaciae TaxID=2681555 RepID=UPI0013D05060|nr:sugar ABC transporter permease [Fodinicola acaciae]